MSGGEERNSHNLPTLSNSQPPIGFVSTWRIPIDNGFCTPPVFFRFGLFDCIHPIKNFISGYWYWFINLLSYISRSYCISCHMINKNLFYFYTWYFLLSTFFIF